MIGLLITKMVLKIKVTGIIIIMIVVVIKLMITRKELAITNTHP